MCDNDATIVSVHWLSRTISPNLFLQKDILALFSYTVCSQASARQNSSGTSKMGSSNFGTWTEEMFSCRMLSLVNDIKSIHYYGALQNQVPKDVSIVGCAMGRSWTSWASWKGPPRRILCPTAQHTPPRGATKSSVCIKIHIWPSKLLFQYTLQNFVVLLCVTNKNSRVLPWPMPKHYLSDKLTLTVNMGQVGFLWNNHSWYQHRRPPCLGRVHLISVVRLW